MDIETSSVEFDIQPSFYKLKKELGWKEATKQCIIHYFPHYQYKPVGVIQIEERPSWFYCIIYGLQHVLAMFSGIIILPLVLGYDSNTSLFFSGIATLIFIVVTGGRIPSYLGCSGAIISAVISITGYQYSPSAGLNTHIAPVQGAILVLGLVYVFISLLVIFLGHTWLEFIMPPIVTGSIITSIGLHLVFMSFNQITTTHFDTWIAVATILSIMFISVYAPFPAIQRLSILLGTMIGYFIYAMCNLKGLGTPIDYSEIVHSQWIKPPTIYTRIEFDSVSIGMVMPLIVILLAENLGHMKAIQSITNRPVLNHVGRAFLGDALGCIVAGLGGTIPYTTYAENIGVLSFTQVFSSLVLLFAGTISMILGFFGKFSAIIRSIPQGVIGGVTFVLYTMIAMTGVRIWIIYKIDFNEPRHVFIGGLPLVLAIVMQTPLQINNFQLDGIGAATFSSIILYQLLNLKQPIQKAKGHLLKK